MLDDQGERETEHLTEYISSLNESISHASVILKLGQNGGQSVGGV